MQPGLFPKREQFKTIVDARHILTIIPAQMISAYVPYQSGLDLESAAGLALKLDEEAKQNFILSTE